MVHGRYTIINMQLAGKQPTANWMGKWRSRSATDGTQVEPPTANEIRAWLSVQTTWNKVGDLNRDLTDAQLSTLRNIGYLENSSLATLVNKLRSLETSEPPPIVLPPDDPCVGSQGEDLCPPTPPPLDLPPPDNTWVQITPGIFSLENNRVVGDITFIAKQNFQMSFSPVKSIVEITDLNGANVINPKQNTLNFTATERDEIISINEGAGGLTEVRVNIFAWTQQNIALAPVRTFMLRLVDPPQVPPTTGGGINGTIPKVIAGLFMGGVALAFMKGFKK